MEAKMSLRPSKGASPHTVANHYIQLKNSNLSRERRPPRLPRLFPQRLRLQRRAAPSVARGAHGAADAATQSDFDGSHRVGACAACAARRRPARAHQPGGACPVGSIPRVGERGAMREGGLRRVGQPARATAAQVQVGAPVRGALWDGRRGVRRMHRRSDCYSRADRNLAASQAHAWSVLSPPRVSARHRQPCSGRLDTSRA